MLDRDSSILGKLKEAGFRCPASSKSSKDRVSKKILRRYIGDNRLAVTAGDYEPEYIIVKFEPDMLRIVPGVENPSLPQVTINIP